MKSKTGRRLAARSNMHRKCKGLRNIATGKSARPWIRMGLQNRGSVSLVATRFEDASVHLYLLVFYASLKAQDGSRSVKILVCMKQVPQKDAPLKLNEAGTWIREDVSYEVNEPDAFALEEALRQKEKHTGEVVVVTAGPARAQQVLREALAKGADRAIHLEDDGFVGLDAYNTARAIAAAIKDETV